MNGYTERLYVPLRWWVQATMFLATVWLAFVVALPAWLAWVASLLLLALVYGMFVLVGAAKVTIGDGVLSAGRASIPVALLGPAEALDKDDYRRVLGVDADARAYLLTRPYLHRGVRVPVTDPQDRTPYWLVASRHPRRLAEALQQERDRGSDARMSG